MSATQRALRIPELLHQILLNFSPEDNRAFMRGDRNPFVSLLQYDEFFLNRQSQIVLANVARCCRLLSGPALDLLWRVMTSIIPLLSIIGAIKIPDQWQNYYHVRKLAVYCKQKLTAFRRL